MITDKKQQQLMKIGKVAEITGLTKDTIRYYEKIGVIPKPHRRPSGYREYEQQFIDRLLFIKETQKLGFTLDEINTLLNMKFDSEVTTGEVKQFFEKKIEDIEEKITHLKVVKNALTEASSRCEGGNQPVEQCAILNFIDMKIFNKNRNTYEKT